MGISLSRLFQFDLGCPLLFQATTLTSAVIIFCIPLHLFCKQKNKK